MRARAGLEEGRVTHRAPIARRCRTARLTAVSWLERGGVVEPLALRPAAAAAVLLQRRQRIGIHPGVPKDARLGLAVLVDALVARKTLAREVGHHALRHRCSLRS